MSSSVKRMLVAVNISWMAIVITGLSLVFLSIHDKRQLADLARQCCWILVSINFLVIAVVEKNWKYKTMFMNLFFVTGTLRVLDLMAFFGFFSAVSNDEFVDHYVYQYLSCGVIPVMQFFTVLYAGIVFAVKKISIIATYLTCILVATPIAFFIYYPYLENAKYLYTVEDITDFRIIDRGIKEFEYLEKKKVENERLATTIRLMKWESQQSGVELTAQEKIERIEEIRPYIEGQNYVLLLFKPIHVDVSLVNLFCVGALLGVLLFQLAIDPPQSPYIDKMLLVFLIYFSLESLHYFIYSKTIELDSYWDKFTISALMSLTSIMLLLPVLWMRLGFSTSAAGNYYQDKIDSSPSQVSRWRDGIDNAVLRSLVGRVPFSRRFVISRGPPKSVSKHGDNGADPTPKKFG